MRNARIKIDHQPTWYHCYNRIAGTSLDLPFLDAEKEKFVRILHRVSLLYSVQVVAYQVMSNHFHLLIYAPDQEPTAEEMCRRFKAFHGKKRTLQPDSKACRAWQARCRDISWFMRHLQQLFTTWYNRTRPVRRRGSLWADRFKHTLLESGAAVWNCWSYIENNPVRAGMVMNAADYRFCSHGAWHQSGRHPFAANVKATALPVLRGMFGLESLMEIRERMDMALAAKADQKVETTGFSLTVQRRVRHWTNGLVIGSQLYLREVMSRHRREEDVLRHRPARAQDDATLYAWRRLRYTT
jgi:REP element-mobilizing transposase RayT